jgi:diaminopimelate epimerase
MLLQTAAGYDFEMVYYNSDGRESSMCGNGGRCIVEFARYLKLVKDTAYFLATDGDHEARLGQGTVRLKMNNVSRIDLQAGYAYLNTGSPHYVAFVNDVESYDVVSEGRRIRHDERFGKGGTNVNFVEKKYNELFVRTFERGVEDETYSCGTGVTAAALIASLREVATTDTGCEIRTLGGKLSVSFRRHSDNTFTDIWLEGPAMQVFQGTIQIDK